MKRLFSIVFTLSFCAAMTLAASAQEKTGSEMSHSAKQSAGMGNTDTTFVRKAAEGGLAEVELGHLAIQKASSEDVKDFGQRMVNDHTKANDQLKQLAEKEHWNLPDTLDAKDKMTKAHLEKLSGAQFDKAYMRDMVKDHQKDVAEFEHESKMAKDPAVKSFAEQTLPTLKEHLKAAEKIAPKQETAKTTGE